MNKLGFLLLLIVGFAVVQTTHAQIGATTNTPSPSTSRGLKATEKATQRTANLTTRLENLRARGITEIDRRLDALSKLTTRIDALKRLTDEQKTSLKTDIQSQIENLNTLRTKIESDTDAATLRTDIKSIRDSYRIYALYMPKLRIFVAVDVMNNAYNKMTELATKLETRIAEAKSSGEDTTELETALETLRTELESAKTNYEAAETAVLPLTPEGYPGNKTQLQEAQTKLRAARVDLQEARSEASTIISSLKSFNSTKVATPSPTEE